MLLIIVAGTRAESPVSNALTRKLLVTVLVAVALSGALVSLGSVLAYISSAEEAFLYAPVHGTGAVAAALAVSAHQVAGDAPLLSWLRYSHLPLLTVAVSLAAQYGSPAHRISNDAVLTTLSLVISWIFLRWVYPYAPGSIGDTRDAFDFLSMVPAPLRCVLRNCTRIFRLLCSSPRV